ncbi:hypothetical protein [Sphingobacterium deserti]|nr:hypothetical protein [Sphingobacterium deserti]
MIDDTHLISKGVNRRANNLGWVAKRLFGKTFTRLVNDGERFVNEVLSSEYLHLIVSNDNIVVEKGEGKRYRRNITRREIWNRAFGISKIACKHALKNMVS